MDTKIYSVKQLADLAGVSIRTLHYYDQIGLLKPLGQTPNRYRYYGEKELLRLQQILFYREMDFSLGEIKSNLAKPDFDVQSALRSHRKLLQIKIARLKKLETTINKTLSYIKGETKMQEQDYFGGFSKEQQKKYEEEIRQKYGSAALDESKNRLKKWNKTDFTRVNTEGDKIFRAICDNMDKGIESPVIQDQVKALHQWLNNFYACSTEMFEGLGRMYNEHPDFIKMWQTKYHQDMPGFLQRSIEYYCRRT